MNTTLTIKIDKKTKDESQKLADALGFTLTAVIKAQLRSFVRTKKIEVSLDEEKPTPYFLKVLDEAEQDIQKGHVTSFENADEVLTYLDQEIADERKKKTSN